MKRAPERNPEARERIPDPVERGSALVGAVVFVLVLSTIGLAYLGFPANEARDIRRDYEDLRIRWAAEEALSQGLARANRVAQPRDTILTAIDTGDYPARFRIRRLDDSRFPRYLVYASVHDKSLASTPMCSLSAVVQAGTAISEHFIIEDNAGGKFYFTGDTIDGPVHSNTRFAIAGSPIFTDPVFEMGDVKDGFILHPEFSATPKLESGKPQGGEKYRFDNMSSLIRNVPPAQKIRPDPGLVLSIAFKGPLMELSYRDRTVKDVYSTPITRTIPKEGGLFVDGEVEVKGILSKS
ncbi:MAG TPA: hypothetical protein VJ385_05825, partial [Fibrobacteria bacterium]|nr:hypothetical protein [Fibrobacteria bacterium]